MTNAWSFLAGKYSCQNVSYIMYFFLLFFPYQNFYMASFVFQDVKVEVSRGQLLSSYGIVLKLYFLSVISDS